MLAMDRRRPAEDDAYARIRVSTLRTKPRMWRCRRVVKSSSAIFDQRAGNLSLHRYRSGDERRPLPVAVAGERQLSDARERGTGSRLCRRTRSLIIEASPRRRGRVGTGAGTAWRNCRSRCNQAGRTAEHGDAVRHLRHVVARTRARRNRCRSRCHLAVRLDTRASSGSASAQ